MVDYQQQSFKIGNCNDVSSVFSREDQRRCQRLGESLLSSPIRKDRLCLVLVDHLKITLTGIFNWQMSNCFFLTFISSIKLFTDHNNLWLYKNLEHHNMTSSHKSTFKSIQDTQENFAFLLYVWEQYLYLFRDTQRSTWSSWLTLV